MTETGGTPACKRCAQVEDLLQQVAELQEEVRRPCDIREAEMELNSWFQAQLAVDLQPNSQRFPHGHVQKGEGPITQKDGSLQWQGPAGGKGFPQRLRCPCRTTLLLHRLKGRDPSHQERHWS